MFHYITILYEIFLSTNKDKCPAQHSNPRLKSIFFLSVDTQNKNQQNSHAAARLVINARNAIGWVLPGGRPLQFRRNLANAVGVQPERWL